MTRDEIRAILVTAEAEGIIKSVKGQDRGKPAKLYYVPWEDPQ